jgi:hypothetical protein
MIIYLTQLVISDNNSISLKKLFITFYYFIPSLSYLGTNSRVLLLSYLHVNDMIWHVDAGRPQICWSIYRMLMTVQFGSLMICLDKNTVVQIIFKNFYFLVWVPNSEERKIKSLEPVPKSASEDRRVALLRRGYAYLEIGVGVRGVGIGLELREWIRVDCITY